mgnify:CR=1 FL=1
MKEKIKEISPYVLIVVVIVVIRIFIATPVKVDGDSMYNTLNDNDIVLLSKLSSIDRFDIIVLKENDNNATIIKRVIGMPGDKVVISNAKVYINDSKTPLNETYLPEEWTQVNGDEEPLEYKVPKGCYFLMGDNRNNSSDARFWKNTYVKRSKIIAKAEFKYWPWNHKGFFAKVKYAQ